MKSKHEYVKEMQHLVDRFGKELDELSERVERRALRGKLTFKEWSSSLGHKRDAMVAKLDALRAGTDEGWESVRDELTDVWDETQSAWQQLVRKVREEEGTAQEPAGRV